MAEGSGWGAWRAAKPGYEASFDALARAMRTLIRVRILGASAAHLIEKQLETCRTLWGRVQRPPAGTVIDWPYDLRALAIELGFDPDAREDGDIDMRFDTRIGAPPPPYRPVGAEPSPPPSLTEARALRDGYAQRRADPSPHAPFAMIAGFEAAADRGELDAYRELAECHLRAWGVEHDEPSAHLALSRGARAGSRACGLALLELLLERPDEEARRHEPELAELLAFVLSDDVDGRGRLLAGWAAFRGVGAPQSKTRCFALQSEAAAVGNVAAMFELYCLLSTGDGVPRDEAKALEHLTRAAELGHARACYSLGAHHAQGRGLAQSWPEAVRWYTRSAELGNPRAAATLAVMYESGEGVERDAERAAFYRGAP